MKSLSIFVLKVFRKGYSKIFPKPFFKVECVQDSEVAAELICNVLMNDEPCMIARFGAFELNTLANYIGIKRGRQSFFSYIKGNELDWWWNKSLINYMHTNAGFFPPTVSKIEQFCELMLQDIPKIDILGSWLSSEILFENELGSHHKINFELLNPYFSQIPWTKALEGKKVLVVHPFAHSIENQYKKRTLLFKNNLLPQFELTTIKAVQTIAGNPTQFEDWFEALDYMKSEIDKQDYDICLIGCGAYGFPLAAHVKRKGRKAIQLGGSLQLLFGIRGKRWEDPDYNTTYNYEQLINKYWVNPRIEEKPAGANMVEGACYW